MFFSETLYQKYLEELRTLDNFKTEYARRTLGKIQDLSDDPYTRHLVEAMAFFTARNRLQGEEKIIALYRRMFRQYFPFLCNALPSMGMLQLTPPLDQTEKLECAAGTEIRITTVEKKKAYFQTMCATQVLPFRTAKSFFAYSETGVSKFYLQFACSHATNESIDTLKLYTNLLNDYPSSLSLCLALKRHLKKIEIAYDAQEFSGMKGALCPFEFNLQEENPLIHHPVEKIRSLMHFPEQELFIHLSVPTHVKKWRTFTLCFHLSSPWPLKFQLASDSLLPFVVPIMNLKKIPAAPIRCDGSKELYPILYPDPEDHFSLHSVRGVYQIEKHRMIPLKPAIFSHSTETYEIEEVSTQNQRAAPRLILNFKDAFQNPKIVSTDAIWHQPWFSYELEKEFKMTLLDQTLTSLDLRILGSIYPAELQAGLDDIQFLIYVLGLKNDARLSLENLLFLMNALKPHKTSYFKEIPSFIKDFSIQYLPTFRNAIVSDEYQFFLEKMDDKNRDLSLVYFKHLKDFLHNWLTNFEVKLSLISPQFQNEGNAHETSLLV